MTFFLRSILILVVVMHCNFLVAQNQIQYENDYQFNLIDSCQIDSGKYYIDNSNYIYVVKENEIKKYSYEGELLFRYSNLLLGEISSIDVSNPLKVYVFYKENSQLVILDNTLTQRGEVISLSDKDLYQTTALGYNYMDNGIWVFDQSFFQLIRLNENYERTYESGNIAEILGLENLSVLSISIKHKFIYLTTEKNGLLVFDIYGTFYKKIPLKNIDQIQVTENFIFYQSNNEYFVYNQLDFESKEIVLPVKQSDFIWNTDNQLWSIHKGKVQKFKIVEK